MPICAPPSNHTSSGEMSKLIFFLRYAFFMNISGINDAPESKVIFFEEPIKTKTKPGVLKLKEINITNSTVLPLILTNSIVDKLLYKKQKSTLPFGMYN